MLHDLVTLGRLRHCFPNLNFKLSLKHRISLKFINFPLFCSHAPLKTLHWLMCILFGIYSELTLKAEFEADPSRQYMSNNLGIPFQQYYYRRYYAYIKLMKLPHFSEIKRNAYNLNVWDNEINIFLGE